MAHVSPGTIGRGVSLCQLLKWRKSLARRHLSKIGKFNRPPKDTHDHQKEKNLVDHQLELHNFKRAFNCVKGWIGRLPTCYRGLKNVRRSKIASLPPSNNIYLPLDRSSEDSFTHSASVSEIRDRLDSTTYIINLAPIRSPKYLKSMTSLYKHVVSSTDKRLICDAPVPSFLLRLLQCLKSMTSLYKHVVSSADKRLICDAPVPSFLLRLLQCLKSMNSLYKHVVSSTDKRLICDAPVPSFLFRLLQCLKSMTSLYKHIVSSTDKRLIWDAPVPSFLLRLLQCLKSMTSLYKHVVSSTDKRLICDAPVPSFFFTFRIYYFKIKVMYCCCLWDISPTITGYCHSESTKYVHST
ncbi:hypothetical protein J6590_056654 [Homalodisca vitripennis]|nr:hypothetical protein J6590_056654 [Homalodisca vitripennis]